MGKLTSEMVEKYLRTPFTVLSILKSLGKSLETSKMVEIYLRTSFTILSFFGKASELFVNLRNFQKNVLERF